MEGIFQEEVSSFVSGDGNFGVGDVSGDIAAARLRQRLLPSNDSSSSFYSNLPPIDINRWQGENILNIENNLSSFEEESHGNTDILIGSNIDATSVVENALPMVQYLLHNFSSKADFKEQMNLAFGDNYDVSKAEVLVDSWGAESLGFLPEIKIVSEDEINGAKGAFAGETETIYLAQEFVWENLGNVGAIADVIVEEFGHYIDGEINSFDTPGDEGEIFVDLVRGVELSADELLAKQKEDDWAIGFLNGERVGIEQKVEADTLDFFAENIPFPGIPTQGINDYLEDNFTVGPLPIDAGPGQATIPLSNPIAALGGANLGFDYDVKGSIALFPFLEILNLGEISRIDYPMGINIKLPNNIESNQSKPIEIISADPTKPSIEATGLELPDAGVKIKHGLDKFSLTDFTVGNLPFLEEPLAKLPPEFRIDLPGFPEKTKTLISLAPELGFKGAETGDFLKISVTRPDVTKFENELVPGDENFPSVKATSTDGKSFIKLSGDLDQIVMTAIPIFGTEYLAAKASVEKGTGGNVKLAGLGVSAKLPLSFASKFLNDDSRLSAGLNIDLLALTANAELGLEQMFQFNPKDLQITASVDKGTITIDEGIGNTIGKNTLALKEAQNTPFQVVAPSQGSGIIKLNLEYKLSGEVTNDLDGIFKGNLGAEIAKVELNLNLAKKLETPVNSESKKDEFSVKNPGQFSLSDFLGLPKKTPDLELGQIPLAGSDDFLKIPTINLSSVGVEDQTKDLIITKTYEIPYNMPVSISDSDTTLAEGHDPPPGEGKAYFKFGSQLYEWETYTVQPGDTLSKIALARLGSSSADAYNFIGFHNNISNPDLIFANSQVIEVPKQVQEPDRKGYAVFNITQSGTPSTPVKIAFNTADGSAMAGSDYLSTSGNLSIPAGGGAVIFVPIVGDKEKEEPKTEDFNVVLTKQDGTPFADGVDEIEATGTIIDDDKKEPDPPEPPLPNPREFNDPRYITIDGKSLEFQAAGEFTLLESLNDDFKIQVRQEPVDNNPLNNAANATAIATILGGKRVGLYKDGQQLLIDGTPVNIPDNEWIPVGDGRIYREGEVYSLVYPKGDQLIATMTESRVNVSLFFNKDRRDTVRGIFGTFNDNPEDDIIKRDGTVLTEPIALEQLYGDYADSWRVGLNESLFDYKPGENTNTFTISNYPREKVQLSDLNPADVQKANELIGERINEIDPTLREGAIIDFILTGFDETIIEEAIAAGSVSAGSVVILDELGARDDFAFTNANLPIKLDILSNDTVNPNTPIAIASFDQISTGGGNITQDNNGTPDDPSDDQLFYTPPINFTGTDRFKYTIFDGTQPSTAIVSINIPNLNLATLPNNQGVVIKSTTPGNFTGVAVNQIGDINGDNIDDIATGAFAADPEGNNAAGETYVIFGTNQPVPNNIDPNTLNGSNGFSLEGFVQTGFSGGAVSSAGDVNKDGINDMIIGAFGVTTNGQNNVGQAYVIFGSRDLFPPTIDIASLDGTNGFALTGLYEFDYAGSAVGSAGDFNRDGIDDVFVSAPGPLNGQAGRTYVLFGNSSGFPPSQNLAQLNGTNGVIIDGLYTKSGGSVSSAGDVNQDGYDDLIIGADIGGTDSYVVYGGESLPATTYLSNLANGFKIFGVDVVTDNGTNVSGVGDVNNDGIDDVIVGVTGTTADGVSGVSKGYVIFGEAGGLPSDVDVKTLNGTNGFVITSANIDGISGMAVSGKGDFNQDGIADIILGKPNDNGNTGNSYVIFGSKESFPTNIDLASLNGTNGIAILGTETDDLTGVSVASAGDVNQDTVDDVIIGAPGNLFNDSPGKSYVVFGDGNFGNSVSLVFDEGYYLANNPEVNSAILSGLVRNGLEHFSQYGVDEERDFRVFLFNEKYYLEQNPDVANLVAQGAYSNGLEHFTQLGQFEGRKPSPATTTTAEINFDEQYYLTQNPDVKSLVEQGILSSGFEHYIEVGQFQQRQTAG